MDRRSRPQAVATLIEDGPQPDRRRDVLERVLAGLRSLPERPVIGGAELCAVVVHDGAGTVERGWYEASLADGTAMEAPDCTMLAQACAEVLQRRRQPGAGGC